MGSQVHVYLYFKAHKIHIIISLYEIKQILLFMTFMFPNKTKARLTEPVI